MQHIMDGPHRPRSGERGAAATVPPLVSGQLVREWAFSELRGDSLEEVEVDDGIQVDGLLHELHDFGPTFRDSDVFSPDGTSLPSDGIATGQIASTADGVTSPVAVVVPLKAEDLEDFVLSYGEQFVRDRLAADAELEDGTTSSLEDVVGELDA